MANLSPTEEVARQVLRKLKAWCDLSDEEIARRSGMSRQSVSYRLTGRLKIGVEQLEAFARAFDVPRDLFFMPANDAIRWVMDREEAAAQAEFEPAPTRAVPIKSTKYGHLRLLNQPDISRTTVAA